MYQSPLMLGLYSPEEDLSTPTHNHAHIHVYLGAHPCTYAHTHAHTCAHLRTNAHTRTHPGIPAHTPQIPADTINLINHVKLYINRPNTKKADR